MLREFPTSPLYLDGHYRRDDADLVLLVGGRAPWYRRGNGRRAQIVAIQTIRSRSTWSIRIARRRLSRGRLAEALTLMIATDQT